MKTYLAAATLAGLLFAGCGSAAATTYYVDSTGGNDTNSGTSIATPWQTLGKVSRSSFPSGTKIYLKRGAVWNEPLSIPNDNITIDAYGTGDLPKIDGSVSISDWSHEEGDLYSKSVTLVRGSTLESGEALGNLSKDGVMMGFKPWNHDLNKTFTSAAYDTYSYKYPNLLYIKVATNPGGNAWRASIKLFGIFAKAKSGIAVKNIQVTRFSLHGIEFDNCSSCSASGVTVTQGGGAYLGLNPAPPPPDYQYAGNGIAFDNSSTDGSVSNSVVSEIFDSGISPQTYMANQTAGNFTFSNSAIDRCGYAGVEISVLSNGRSTGSSISGVTLESDTIKDSGRGWSGRRRGALGMGVIIGDDFAAGTIAGVNLSNVTISGSAADAIRIFGKALHTVTISGARINNNDGNGVNFSDTSESDLKLVLQNSLIYKNLGHGVLVDAPSLTDVDLNQNTFYSNGSENVVLNSNPRAVGIKNNFFISDVAMTQLSLKGAMTNVALDHNCYSKNVDMVRYNGTGFSTLDSFTASTGFEHNGNDGPIEMINPAAGDFTPVKSSSCPYSLK